MREKFFIKSISMAVSITIIFVLFCSCNSNKKAQYYSQKENYINVTGTVSSIKYNKNFTTLYLEFYDLSPVLDDTCFKIVGENLKIVQRNGIDEKICLGEQISFITAPKYFGDGYVMPIVGISAKGETLLDFEEGYINLLNNS